MRSIVIPLYSMVLLAEAAAAYAGEAAPVQGDYVLPEFRFSTGEVMQDLRLHYATLGKPERDAGGHIVNAVLLLHGTGGRGGNFLRPEWAGELYGPGQPLDISRYYLILPDDLGHGASSKPSDGLRGRFPHYIYDDLVLAQRRLLADGLGVDHLRLIVGTSMGCMHAWMWAESYPDAMDAVVPMACLPAAVAGRNRMDRRAIADAIRNDPAWNRGDYARQPPGLLSALEIAFITGAGARELYLTAPTPEAADKLLDDTVRKSFGATDANDYLYAWESSRGYDPSGGLERIRAAVLAINFADDERNPPELGIVEREIGRVPGARYVLIPQSDATHGHRTFYYAALWKQYLIELLARLDRR